MLAYTNDLLQVRIPILPMYHYRAYVTIHVLNFVIAPQSSGTHPP
jgi:hypothetical protein